MKIIKQIMPAPVNAVAAYSQDDEPYFYTVPIACLVLFDEGGDDDGTCVGYMTDSEIDNGGVADDSEEADLGIHRLPEGLADLRARAIRAHARDAATSGAPNASELRKRPSLKKSKA